MTTPIPKAALVGAALHIPKQEERRAVLRKLAMPLIEAEPATNIRDAFLVSPLVGTATNQIKPAPTHSGLRDALCEDALVGIASGLVSVREVLEAISDPSTFGVRSTKSKTGYAFGLRTGTRAGTWVRGDCQRSFEAFVVGSGLGIEPLRDAFLAELGLVSTIGTIPTTRAIRDAVARAMSPSHTSVASASTTKTTETHMAKTKTATAPTVPASEFVLGDAATIYENLVKFDGHDAKEVESAIIDLLKAHGGKDGEAAAEALVAIIKADPPKPEAKREMDEAGKAYEQVVLHAIGALHSVDVKDTSSSIGRARLEVEVPEVAPSMKAAVNAVLGASGLPPIETLLDQLKKAADVANEAIDEANALRTSSARAALAVAMPAVVAASPTGELPSGKTVLQSAAAVFGIKGSAAKLFAFDVPTFDWDFPHPHVPNIDADYVFRPQQLLTLLVAIVKNKRPWLHGHTGCGKSTFVEQVAARLNWPVIRVNFDSEITRMDLIGRDTLTTDPTTGQTVTKWVDGVLPQALSGPYMLLLDEIDFVRPDVSYVLQRALEGKGMVVNEDGGRVIVPHPMCRIIATANTVGQGDEHGLYQGARPQSMAFLDRWTPFIPVPYMSAEDEKGIILARNPGLDAKAADTIARYITEHRQAFTNAEIMQPLSPRGIGELAGDFMFYFVTMGDPKKAITKSFEDNVLGKANQQDRAVLKGIVDRVLK